MLFCGAVFPNRRAPRAAYFSGRKIWGGGGNNFGGDKLAYLKACIVSVKPKLKNIKNRNYSAKASEINKRKEDRGFPSVTIEIIAIWRLLQRDLDRDRCQLKS